MSYHVMFQKADEKELDVFLSSSGSSSLASSSAFPQQQHCMRCHQSFDPDKNSSTACVLVKPHPFMGRHTTNAKEVDYTKFDICNPMKCGRVLHSFTFHLRLIQAEKESRELEREMDRQDRQFDSILEDQLQFLQKIKMRRAKMTEQQKNQLNPKRVQAVDQQYQEVVKMMVQREQDKLELETWTREVLDPAHKENERKLFLKAPQVEAKARLGWARIQQEAARKTTTRSPQPPEPTTKCEDTSPEPMKSAPLETIQESNSDLQWTDLINRNQNAALNTIQESTDWGDLM